MRYMKRLRARQAACCVGRSVIAAFRQRASMTSPAVLDIRTCKRSLNLPVPAPPLVSVDKRRHLSCSFCVRGDKGAISAAHQTFASGACASLHAFIWALRQISRLFHPRIHHWTFETKSLCYPSRQFLHTFPCRAIKYRSDRQLPRLWCETKAHHP
jgi:hypothetical protein